MGLLRGHARLPTFDSNGSVVKLLVPLLLPVAGIASRLQAAMLKRLTRLRSSPINTHIINIFPISSFAQGGVVELRLLIKKLFDWQTTLRF